MKKIIESNLAPSPVGPYSQAILANNTLYVSGQIAINPEDNSLITSSITHETHQVMKNLTAVLAEANLTMNEVVKCSIFVTDMGSYQAINDVYAQYFLKQPPARELVEVAGLPKGVNVEISCIAINAAG